MPKDIASNLDNVLFQCRELASTLREQGTLFELLIARYLQGVEPYTSLFSHVWLWNDWPLAWGGDTGIDIVAREEATGDYWAIQCKFYEPTNYIQKADIDSFLSASGKGFGDNQGSYYFTRRLIVSTTDRWGRNAEAAIINQSIPVSRLGINDLAESPIDWSEFDPSQQIINLKEKKLLRPHQDEAIKSVMKSFINNDRGQMIMACGTGKTLTSLRLVEKMVQSGGMVLLLAPSISLISQTLREWTTEAMEPIHAFAVCSDTEVGRNDDGMRVHDFAYPATTDFRALERAVRAVGNSRRKVIFSTYQSIDVISRAQGAGLPEFDLIICDEAHRTTGVTLAEDKTSDFQKVHDNDNVKASKRLYMTATPRIYADASKTKANEHNAALYSMNDKAIYGDEFYNLNFGEAVEKGLLSDYKVLIVAVEEGEMSHLINQYNAFRISEDEKYKGIDLSYAAKIIGSWKGLCKQDIKLLDADGTEEDVTTDLSPMRRAVAFSSSIKRSKVITETFHDIVELYNEYFPENETPNLSNCETEHVDGTMNALIRAGYLNWLREDAEADTCRILSNSRCLSEGVDVPALDSVIFFDTRNSIVDIVQSVGRVMRKAEGKQYGYVILPVCIPKKNLADYDNYISQDPQFKGIWRVLKALRAHDERLAVSAEFRKKVIVTGGNTGDGDCGGTEDTESTLSAQLELLPVGEISELLYAAIPKKLGDRDYWETWAKDVANIVGRLDSRIQALLEQSSAKSAFDGFLKGLQDNINPLVDDDEAREMLVQHIITRPIFDALFEDYPFTENNPISKSMEKMLDLMDEHAIDSETEQMDDFYKSVTGRIKAARNDEKEKQEIIRTLYDTFFTNAFPKMAERLGIIYTPVQVVDFIINSVETALNNHLGASISNKDVQIIDPFTGTGTFVTRLLQSGLIKATALPHKYEHELHANEIVLLAYYIATLNIETTYQGIMEDYKSFEGIVLTDTFQMNETRDMVEKTVLPENSDRVNRQKKQPIRVVIGNPPYSAIQKSQNDNNQNLNYPAVDEDIRRTYAEKSVVTNVQNLYDPYIRAIKLASNRIEDKGIIGFITNGKFIDSNFADGMRKCLYEEFDHIYIFNLRGFIRGKSGDDAKREGQNIFDIMTGVAVIILVKNPDHKGDCELFYYDIGDYLKREEKLKIIEDFENINAIDWQSITPNAEGDWIGQRDPAFEKFIPIGDNKTKPKPTEIIFDIYSLGVATNRDPWAYNISKPALADNMARMIDNYNSEVDRYQALPNKKNIKLDDFLNSDPNYVNWSRSLKKNAGSKKKHQFDDEHIVLSTYRPFTKQWLYFSRSFNEIISQQPKLFPNPKHKNTVIAVTGVGARKPFSSFISNSIIDLNAQEAGAQCFPLYWYEKVDQFSSEQKNLLDQRPDEHGFIRHDAITDWALKHFQNHYKDTSIAKENIFYYIYGVLHSDEYRKRFGNNLKKMLPRIPLTKDFWAFSKPGQKLAEIHLNYEEAEPYKLMEGQGTMLVEAEQDFTVHKMTFGKIKGEKDKTTVIYNQNITLSGIPLEAYKYEINGKSAIEWIMDRYAVRKDQKSGIINDPNEWSDNPRYIIDLLKCIVTVSMQTIEIVDALPPLEGNK